jgi:hypothetical protein
VAILQQGFVSAAICSFSSSVLSPENVKARAGSPFQVRRAVMPCRIPIACGLVR